MERGVHVESEDGYSYIKYNTNSSSVVLTFTLKDSKQTSSGKYQVILGERVIITRYKKYPEFIYH